MASVTTRPPPWRDVRILRVLLQVLFVLGVAVVVTWLFDNLVTNLDRVGLSTNFDFLDQPAGFQILGSDFRASQTVQEALVVGITNTISVAAIGIVLATLLGVLVGVLSL